MTLTIQINNNRNNNQEINSSDSSSYDSSDYTKRNIKKKRVLKEGDSIKKLIHSYQKDIKNLRQKLKDVKRKTLRMVTNPIVSRQIHPSGRRFLVLNNGDRVDLDQSDHMAQFNFEVQYHSVTLEDRNSEIFGGVVSNV